MIEKLNFALAALEKSANYMKNTEAVFSQGRMYLDMTLMPSLSKASDQAIADLRSVIAEMEAGEPVAWRYHSVSPFADKDGMYKVSDKWSLIHRPDQRDAHSSMCGMEAEPLYTHPQPKAEPCYCDKNGIGAPGVSCGDCPDRDYKPKAESPKCVKCGDELMSSFASTCYACNQKAK